jgi:hypothetical protein
MEKAEGRRQNEDGGSLIASSALLPPLRFLFILFFTFCLLPSDFCLGQVKGEVESIGFQNYYRPDCWTQMVIRLTPETDKAADYLGRRRSGAA